MAEDSAAPLVDKRKAGLFQEGVERPFSSKGDTSAIGRPWRNTISVSPRSTLVSIPDALLLKSVKVTLFILLLQSVHYCTGGGTGGQIIKKL